MKKELISISKFLSLVLRHEPQAIGITLDEEGWVDVGDLLRACERHGRPITRLQLNETVATNDKQRFAFSIDGSRIRANQGHSVHVDLGLTPREPPELLYHGTVSKVLESIRCQGLQRGHRHHVHLSNDERTASMIGQRRGKPVILVIEANRMFREGYPFYQSENGVWLTDSVPVTYLRFPTEQ